MDPLYLDRYRDLYQRHWWWRAREAAILAELRRLPPRAEGGRRILDVGCGSGLFFERLQPFGAVEGVEPERSLAENAGRWREAIHPVPFDERFRSEQPFDVILMLDVLEHLERPDAALQHAVRLLAPGGQVLITVPAFAWLWTRHDALNRHVRRYDRLALRTVARAAGLRVIRERFLFQWLVPVKLLTRVWESVRAGSPTPPTVPIAPVNRLLYWWCRMELAVAARLPIPFGGSLLVRAEADSGG